MCAIGEEQMDAKFFCRTFSYLGGSSTHTSQMTCGNVPTRLTFVSSRHKRTHDRGDGVEGSFNFSGEEEEEFSGEDQLGPLEEASPNSEAGYVTTSLNSAVSAQTASATTIAPANTVAQNVSFTSLQTLSMPMTLSQPHAINAGAMV